MSDTSTTQAEADAEAPAPGPDDAAPVVLRRTDEEADTSRPVGWIGLGATGLPLAANLARRFAVLGCDRDASRLSLLMDEVGPAGAVHTTPVVAEIAARCDIIVLMLPAPGGVDSVLAVLDDGLRAGTLVIDMGTADPAKTRRLAAELSDRSVHLIDAPACGSIAEARAGRVTILAGGAEAVVAQAVPYLRALGEPVIRTGPIGSAHAMAALRGFVEVAGAIAAMEASRIAEASGLETDLLAAALGASRPRDPAAAAALGAELEVAALIATEANAPGDLLAAARAIWPRVLGVAGDAQGAPAEPSPP